MNSDKSAANIPAYRPDIDGLRAVAILGVIAYHTGIWGVSGGFLGVDIFFVISGYLITSLLYKEISATGRISLADFYARRARRLLPALFTVLIVTLTAGNWLLPPSDRIQLTESALASLGFVANQFFLANTGGYFDGPSDLKPLLHLWSLSVEEQFYLVWPLVLIAIARLASQKQRLTWIRLSIALITAASLLLGVWLHRAGNSSAAFFAAPSRAWELGIGALIALWPASQSFRIGAVSKVSSNVGALMICIAYFLTSAEFGFQPRAMLIAVIGTAMIIFGNAAAPESKVARFLSHRSLVAIGKLSYSWYLWHWPLLSLASNVTQKNATIWINLVCVLVALLLAAVTVKYVENPIRHGKSSRHKSKRTLRLGGAALVSLAVLIVGLLLNQQYGPRTDSERLFESIATDIPREYTDHCIIERGDWNASTPGECLYGPKTQPIRLAVYGDSHAAHWMPMIETALAPDPLVTFAQFTMSGCQPLAPGVLKLSAKINVCNAYAKHALPKILALRAAGLKGVVLAGRWSQPRRIAWSRFPSSPYRPTAADVVNSAMQSLGIVSTAHAEPAQQFLRDGLTPVLDALQNAGLKVLILLDAPEEKYPTPLCVYYSFESKERCGVSRLEYEQAFGEDRATIKTLAASYPSVRVFDPVPYVCGTDYCPAFLQDHPVLMDDSHLAASTARTLASYVQDDLNWLLK